MILFVVGSGLREVCGDQAALGISFIRNARTAPIYRLYEIDGRFATLVEVGKGGISVPGEICSIADEQADELLRGEPEGVSSLPVMLSDGQTALGPVSTLDTLPKASNDISRYGGFAAFYSEMRRMPK